MRAPSLYLGRRTPIDLQLTPMIDCVFLLMVYFIWSSSFTITEQMLPAQLSRQSGRGSEATDRVLEPIEDFEPLVVRIFRAAGQPSWTIRDVPVPSLAVLRQQLAAAAAIKRDAPVILHPDPEVPLGDVIDVYDLARLAGFETVQFAATEG
jgi:biopolymer transport protein ExbD